MGPGDGRFIVTPNSVVRKKGISWRLDTRFKPLQSPRMNRHVFTRNRRIVSNCSSGWVEMIVAVFFRASSFVRRHCLA